jgi:hypothetical protein
MSDSEEISPKNEYIDKLTMELLLNKNHYAKYLANTDPKKHDEYKSFKSKLRKHSVDIIDITSQMIENPKDALSADIEEAFDIYVKSILRHFELKEFESPPEKQESDEDILFGQMDETPSASQSFWGKDRVVKKSASPFSADIRAFSSGKVHGQNS